MKKLLILVGLLCLCYGNAAGQAVEDDFKVNESQKVFLNAYRQLINGTYNDKKKAVAVFNESFSNDLVIEMCIKLLRFYYRNEKFRENDEKMYKDNVIAEDLVKILDRSDSDKAFAVFLDIVSNPRFHRQATVRAAWMAMQDIEWQ